MLFILYSEINAASIGSNLGMPEYSYYFVLKGFHKALQMIGDVVIVQNPAEEVDSIYRDKQREGVPCLFLSFSPPNKTLVSLACPTICVFAWEFSNLPYETWDDDPRNDWRASLARIAGAITLSTHTAQVVKEAMGDAYPVCAIPVPVYDRARTGSGSNARSPLSRHTLAVNCTVIDSGFYRGDGETFSADIPVNCFRPREWRGERVELQFKRDDEGAALMGGFYEPEPWGGAWSKIAEPWVLLPFIVVGRCKIGVELTAYGPNVGREASIKVGEQIFPLPLRNDFVSHEFVCDVQTPINIVHFGGLDITVPPDARDMRSMGIGLRRLWIEGLGDNCAQPGAQPEPVAVALDGVVYTSVLNPGDGRKNWLEMLTAFCFAFRNEPRATLVFKMTHRSIGSFLERFHYTLQRIGAVRCKVIILHGYLDDETYQSLVDATSYYVNSSQCEGLCLPLMEFMSCGVPALAPAHTAMADYVTADNAFVIESSLEPGVWPHDPRDLMRTLRYRLNWRSLADAFAESFDVALNRPERYGQMSCCASETQRGFSSLDTVARKLQSFFAGRFDMPAKNAVFSAPGGAS